jgi:hypothetical protein
MASKQEKIHFQRNTEEFISKVLYTFSVGGVCENN